MSGWLTQREVIHACFSVFAWGRKIFFTWRPGFMSLNRGCSREILNTLQAFASCCCQWLTMISVEEGREIQALCLGEWIVCTTAQKSIWESLSMGSKCCNLKCGQVKERQRFQRDQLVSDQCINLLQMLLPNKPAWFNFFFLQILSILYLRIRIIFLHGFSHMCRAELQERGGREGLFSTHVLIIWSWQQIALGQTENVNSKHSGNAC